MGNFAHIPAMITTPELRVEVDESIKHSIPEKIRNILLSKIPMGKMGSGDDVSNCVAFLSSDEASYITGETIHVNGGMYMA